MSKIEEYISKKDWRLKENSNSNFSYADMVRYVAGHKIANYCLNKLYPKEISELHREGYLHIHDLSHGLCSYCVGVDLLILISKGMNFKDLKCYPAKHLSSLCGQILNWLILLQSDNAGAIAINDFDILLTPYVIKDNLSIKRIKQILQELFFGLNVPCRFGESLFTNINLAFKCPKYLKNIPVIIGGENQGYTYGEIKQDDLLDFQKCFLEVLIDQGKKEYHLLFLSLLLILQRIFLIGN